MTRKKSRIKKNKSALIKKLVSALEQREDRKLSLIADIRCAQKEETISHEDLWNGLLKNDPVQS